MKNHKNNTTGESRDRLLGTALARALSETGASGDCLSDQDLAALLERTLSPDDELRLQAHLACCEDCLAHWQLASRLQVPQVQPARHLWPGYAAGLVALAAALVALIFAGRHTAVQTALNAPAPHASPAVPGATQKPSLLATAQEKFVPGREGGETKSPRVPASRSAVALAETVYDGGQPAAAATVAPAAGYGFVGTLPPGKTAFRAGVASVDLGAALRGGDAMARSGAVDRLAGLMGKDADAAAFGELSGAKAPAAVRRRYLALIGRIEERAGRSGEALAFRFGVWCEAGRLAGDQDLRRIVDRSWIAIFSRGLKGDDLPEGARHCLTTLDTLLTSSSDPATDSRRMRRMLDEIVDLY